MSATVTSPHSPAGSAGAVPTVAANAKLGKRLTLTSHPSGLTPPKTPLTTGPLARNNSRCQLPGAIGFDWFSAG